MSSTEELAIILIRGRIGTHHSVKETLDMLRLKRKHACVLVQNTPTNKGMVNKVKDYITWGVIDEETKKALQTTRGRKTPEGTIKPYYLLHPPRGGFERKGTKQPYNLGGALGNRGEGINTLIKNML